MIKLAYILLAFTAFQEKKEDLNNDLFDLSRSFFVAENISEINEIRAKIEQLKVTHQIKQDNIDEVILLKNDIDRLLKLDKGNQLEFIRLANRFKDIYFTRSKNHQEAIDKYTAICPLEKEISIIFGKGSVIEWIYKIKLLDAEACLIENKISSKNIEEIIAVFENKYGADSLFLADLYLYLTFKRIKLKDYLLAKKNCEKIQVLMPRYAGKGGRRNYCVEIYTAKCSMESDDYEKSSAIIASIDSSKFHSLCNGLNYELYFYNSLSSIISDKKNKLSDSIIYQQASLTYLECALNKDHPDVLGEAKKLRELLLRKGDLISVRKLENQYKIKPVAKQPGEK